MDWAQRCAWWWDWCKRGVFWRLKYVSRRRTVTKGVSTTLWVTYLRGTVCARDGELGASMWVGERL